MRKVGVPEDHDPPVGRSLAIWPQTRGLKRDGHAAGSAPSSVALWNGSFTSTCDVQYVRSCGNRPCDHH
jgi:hypothetical protein